MNILLGSNFDVKNLVSRYHDDEDDEDDDDEDDENKDENIYKNKDKNKDEKKEDNINNFKKIEIVDYLPIYKGILNNTDISNDLIKLILFYCGNSISIAEYKNGEDEKKNLDEIYDNLIYLDMVTSDIYFYKKTEYSQAWHDNFYTIIQSCGMNIQNVVYLVSNLLYPKKNNKYIEIKRSDSNYSSTINIYSRIAIWILENEELINIFTKENNSDQKISKKYISNLRLLAGYKLDDDKIESEFIYNIYNDIQTMIIFQHIDFSEADSKTLDVINAFYKKIEVLDADENDFENIIRESSHALNSFFNRCLCRECIYTSGYDINKLIFKLDSISAKYQYNYDHYDDKYKCPIVTNKIKNKKNKNIKSFNKKVNIK